MRCINGEVRLWVNGEEVSGGTNIRPATGYLCLESEGAPVEFPVGVITALIGGPFFLWLLVRSSR